MNKAWQKTYQYGILLLTNMLVSSSWAAGICKDSIPDNYPGKVPADYYGNSHLDSFGCAITGSTDLTEEQRKERAALIPESHQQRFYLRTALNAGSENLLKVKNTTKNDVTTTAIDLTSSSASTGSNQFEIALGYYWRNSSFQIEWINLSSIDFDSEVGGTGVSFTSNVRGHALVAGLNLEVHEYDQFKNYINISFGLTKNNTILQLNNQPEFTKDSYGLTAGLGLGTRINIYSRLYADALLRGIYLGKVEYFNAVGATPNLEMEAHRIWYGASIGLVWVF